MKSNERNTLVGLLVFILVLLVVAGGFFNNISISGEVIEKIKSKYFLYEGKLINKIEKVENKVEKDVDEFYKDVDDVEEEIVNNFEEFADGFVSDFELEMEQEFKERVEEGNLEDLEREDLDDILEGFEEETGELPEIVCSEDYYNCGDFNFAYEAFVVFEICGGRVNDIHGLDKDGNGIACEGLG